MKSSEVMMAESSAVSMGISAVNVKRFQNSPYPIVVIPGLYKACLETL